MKNTNIPGWLESMYNENPSLAKKAEKYIDSLIRITDSDEDEICEQLEIETSRGTHSNYKR